MNPLHYPSLELCKKLPKEICNSGYGYAECQFAGKVYEPVFISKEEFYSVSKSKGNSFIDLNYIFIEAPSVMELLDELPSMIRVEKLCILKITKLITGLYRVAYVNGSGTEVFFIEDTCPNALSKMRIWLKENNLLHKK